MSLHPPADFDELLNALAFVLCPGRALCLCDARHEVLSVMCFHGLRLSTGAGCGTRTHAPFGRDYKSRAVATDANPALLKLAEATGLEPATFAVTGQCSNQIALRLRELMNLWWAVQNSNL